jgi:hypothetical protein
MVLRLGSKSIRRHLTFYIQTFTATLEVDLLRRSNARATSVLEKKDLACATCGKPIEDGTPRYRVLIEDKLGSAHVECYKQLKGD